MTRGVRRNLARVEVGAPKLPGLDDRISLKAAAKLLKCRASVKRLEDFGLKPVAQIDQGALRFTAYNRTEVNQAATAQVAAAKAEAEKVTAAVDAAVAESGVPGAMAPAVAADDGLTLARQHFAVDCEIRDLLKQLTKVLGPKAA